MCQAEVPSHRQAEVRTSFKKTQLCLNIDNSSHGLKSIQKTEVAFPSTLTVLYLVHLQFNEKPGNSNF